MLPSQLLFCWFLCNSIDMSPVNHFSDIYIYIYTWSFNFLFYISWLQSGSLLTRIECIGKFCKYSLSIWVTASMCTFNWKKLVDITAKKRTWTWPQSELWSKLGFKCERICQSVTSCQRVDKSGVAKFTLIITGTAFPSTTMTLKWLDMFSFYCVGRSIWFAFGWQLSQGKFIGFATNFFLLLCVCGWLCGHSKAEFVIYKLREMGKLDDKDIADVIQEFTELDIHNTGKITRAHLQEGS